MKEFFKNFWDTMLCGVLALVGSWMNQPALIILAIIIGGFAQTKEGIMDTINNKSLNVELLMILSAIGACIIGHYMEGAILIFIFSLSGSLEAMTLDRSRKEIESIMALQPTEATLLKEDGSTEVVAIESLKLGDRLLVAVGEIVPTDSIIVDGASNLEEAAITGEPLPKNKSVGDSVFGGTLNVSHPLTIEVNAEISETLLQQIVRMVEESQNYPSKTASFIDKLEDYYARIVLVVVALVILIQMFVFKHTFDASFYKGMVLLVVASPCALIASVTPATLASVSNGARRGILVKGGIHFENMVDVKAVVFDKTGTLTEGLPTLTDYRTTLDQVMVSSAITALEQRSSHPLASAIVSGLKKDIVNLDEPSDVEEVAGFGVQGTYEGSFYKIGKLEFMSQLDDSLVSESKALARDGKSLVYCEKDGVMVAYLALKDVVRESSKNTVAWLNSQNIMTIMITGDNEETARQIGDSVGVGRIIAGALPHEKAHHIEALREEFGSVMMIGDGINDAPALANANVGVAMGSGTDIAMEAADVILVHNNLENVTYSIKLSRKLRKVVIQNILFSFVVIIILVAANFMDRVSLPLGVVGHEGSTILVILNSLRLLRPIQE